jgi:peptidoglycan/LPS O-acetylase OafA/YrhL
MGSAHAIVSTAPADARGFPARVIQRAEEPSLKRSTAIDLLRAAAVFLVLGRHMDVCPPATSHFLNRLTEAWNRGGWIGVDLFFVLSGFLIAGLLFSERRRQGSISFKRFFIRRAFKIYPPFWALILAIAAIGSLSGKPVATSGLVSELLFLQNYGSSLFNHTWSLAVEEHFYLTLPLLLIALSRFSRNKRSPFESIPLCFLIIAVLGLLLRGTRGLAGDFQMSYTHLRIDSLFFGVLLSYYYHSYPERFLTVARDQRWLLLLAGGILLAPAFLIEHRTSYYIYTVGLTQFYFGSGLVLVGMLGCSVPESLPIRLLALVGTRSYSIYLWHMLLLTFVSKALTYYGLIMNWYVYAVASLLGAVALGTAMATLVEFPLLQVRDAFFPSRILPGRAAGIAAANASL